MEHISNFNFYYYFHVKRYANNFLNMRYLPIEVLSFEQKLEPSASSFKYLGSKNKTNFRSRA